MTIAELQALIGAKADGQWGPKSRAALMARFANPLAPALIDADFARAAARLGCSAAQVRAVRVVEADGNGFDAAGRPKILFERHKFHKFTGGRFSPAPFSNPMAGGYDANSWGKLNDAIDTGAVDAAFMAASWGAFQVLGEWWDELHFSSPFAFAVSCVAGEAAQLDIAAGFITVNHLQDALRALSPDPATCRVFAAAYNGPAYAKHKYHEKLARAMRTA